MVARNGSDRLPLAGRSMAGFFREKGFDMDVPGLFTARWGAEGPFGKESLKRQDRPGHVPQIPLDAGIHIVAAARAQQRLLVRGQAVKGPAGDGLAEQTAQLHPAR